MAKKQMKKRTTERFKKKQTRPPYHILERLLLLLLLLLPNNNHHHNHQRNAKIVHILRRNCLLKHVIEGDIEGNRRRKRRRKHLLDDLMKEGKYMNLKEEALDCILWKTRFGICYGPVERQTMQWVIIIIIIIIILGISFMQGIYIYIPETNHVPREHRVAAIHGAHIASSCVDSIVSLR
jgi:uncharacterized integral membrane protein